MAQISYDDQYYYKLVTDAKNQETTKTILGIVPILEAVQIDVVTDTVYFLLRTSYHSHTIVRSVPKQLFCDAYDLAKELMGLGFDITSNTSSSFMQVVLEQEKTAKIEYIHSKLGWFSPAVTDKPNFLFRLSYGNAHTSRYAITNTAQYMGFESEPPSDPEEGFDAWDRRTEFVSNHILSHPGLSILYLLGLSASIVGYLSETGHSLPTIAVQLRGDDIDVAEYLITSMIGEPAAMLASPVNREDIMNGIPLIFHEQQAALPASTVVFTQQECAEAWNICLPIPSIPKKQKLSFLTEAEDAPGLDLIKLAGTILGEGKDEVYDTYLAWLKDFFKYDEMQLHHQKTCAVICTALTYAEIITQLEFDREEIIQYLVDILIPTKHHSKTSQPEYRHIIRWVNQNKKHFTWGRGSGNTKYFDLSHSGNEQIYGKIQMNDAGQPEKYYIRCDYLEKELQKLHCSTQILSEWKQEGLLLCDRGSLWCRRVIDPENSGDKAAVYVLAAMNSMEDPLSDVEIDEGFDANEEPQLLEEAQSDEELFDYSDEDEEEEEPIDIDPNDPEWNPENNPFDEDEDGESEEDADSQHLTTKPSLDESYFDDNELDDDLKGLDLEDDEEQDDDDDNWGPITDEDARFFEDTSSNDQEDESKTYSDEPEYDDNELDDDLKGLDLEDDDEFDDEDDDNS